MTFGPQLVPTLREGIDVIKIVLYRELKRLLLLRHRDPVYANTLTGAVVNDLFGIMHSGTAFESFNQANQEAVEKTFQIICTELDHLKIPLTDALRIQFLCDSHEGMDSTAVLQKAMKRKLLIVERDLPLPGAFMNIARSFGRSYGILDSQPLTAPDTAQTNPNGTDK